jgi:hypothetical protein
VVPATITEGKKQGQKSLAKYTLGQQVHDEARKRVEALLDRFLLYPEIDLKHLLTHMQ